MPWTELCVLLFLLNYMAIGAIWVRQVRREQQKQAVARTAP